MVKGNQTEAQAALGYSRDDPQAVESACQRLVEELGSQAIVITRGASGMAGLSREAGFVTLAAANQSEVYDVVGAGDTVIAVLTMALAAGLPFRIALWLANYAAGLVVRKLGNATTTQQELCWAMEHW